MHIVTRIERLFSERGGTPLGGVAGARVTVLQHALQCAQLAEWGELPAPLVGAALLHDIGHLLGDDEAFGGGAHEVRGAALLADHFGPELVEPVRLHVEAKRYLVTVDADYVVSLSPGSLDALRHQGGPMGRLEARAFEALPYALDAVTLRRLDDVAHHPGRQTPGLRHYLALVERLARAGRGANVDAARPAA